MINNNDTFISDEEDDLCPLCVEEMDISDKNFRPCPCGYQVCQFCYNNIRQNPELNGRCPACRRVYDDESVEYKIVSQEEWKSEQSKQSRKDKEKKQKEKERKESEQANRKHLAGMRVIQKNLVYVVGLNPSVPFEELHTILRSDKYFGQYGKILKIVINKRNPIANAPLNFHSNSGFGVYVTFSKKEEAQKCINAIDGTYIDGRPLKAAFGTTKYCSSYLRGQPCPNPNCMFLHEPGEEADSYTRQDLSTRQGLKMEGETDGFPQKQPAPFQQRYASNGSHFFNGNGSNTATNNGDFVESNSASNSPSISNPVPHPQPVLEAVPLPTTSSWATANKATLTSTVNESSSSLPDTSAFPTLAEATTLQQQIQQQQTQQQQHQRNKQKQHFSDEFNLEVCTNNFVEETLNFLNSLENSINYKIKSAPFDTSYPSLFAFDKSSVYSSTPSSQPRSFQLRLIDSLISKPVQPSAIQQLQVQQAQAQSQGQSQQAQLPSQLAQQQQFSKTQDLQDLQQQQQALLQQQLLQQQLIQQQIQQAQQQQQLKTGTPNPPPPPGLFNPSDLNVPQSQPQQPLGNSSQGGAASELLSHLMNGKKISA